MTIELNYGQLLAGTVDEVLETMFFCFPLGPAEKETGPDVFRALLPFRGQPSGTLEVCLSEASARMLAAGFLGEDEEALTDAQPGEVVCELANMLCGSLVSRLESDRHFDLGSPVLLPAGFAATPYPAVASQTFQLENGILSVTLSLEPAR